MAQLWGGRFTKETDKLGYQFNASISFDKRFYAQDIKGSIAHVMMLGRQGILTEEETEKIMEGLQGILSDVEAGTLEITDQYEDIHSFVEATLIDRIGEAGKKLHTGRSRNDQVALDMKLYTRDEVEALDGLVEELLQALLSIMKEHVDAEDKRKPLTDEELATILKEKGYVIARRTVAKYREQLGIPVARLRKEI